MSSNVSRQRGRGWSPQLVTIGQLPFFRVEPRASLGASQTVNEQEVAMDLFHPGILLHGKKHKALCYGAL